MSMPHKGQSRAPQGNGEGQWIAKYLRQDMAQEKKGFLEGWYRLTAPPTPPLNATLAQHEIARRGRLTSTIMLIALAIAVGLAVPVAIFQNRSLLPIVLVSLTLMTISLIFNRRGLISIAGGILATCMDMGLILAILTTPNGLNSNSVPLYDMMLQTELVAVSLLPPVSVFVVAAVNSTFVVLTLNLMPHTKDLDELLRIAGPEVYARPILLHAIVAVVAFLWVRGALQAIERADRAEVIAELQHNLAEQAHIATEQKELLEKSIGQIIETQQRFANGDLNARVPLNAGNVLWQVAGALNNLLSRLQQARRIEIQAQKMQVKLEHAKRVEHVMGKLQRDLQNLAERLLIARRSRRRVQVQELMGSVPMLDPILSQLEGVILQDAGAVEEMSATPPPPSLPEHSPGPPTSPTHTLRDWRRHTLQPYNDGR